MTTFERRTGDSASPESKSASHSSRLLVGCVVVVFLTLGVLAMVPMTYCPSCFGSGVKDGTVPVSSPEALEAYARDHPCLYCDGKAWNRITWFKSWILKSRMSDEKK